jgi:hypothetical protein
MDNYRGKFVFNDEDQVDKIGDSHWSRHWIRDRIFLYYSTSKPALVHTQMHIQWDLRTFFWSKAARAWSEPYIFINAKAQNDWGSIFLSSVHLCDVVITHRNNYFFCLLSAIEYGVDDLISIPGRGRNFCLRHQVQTDSMAYQFASLRCPGVKRPELVASTEAKNALSFTLFLLVRRHGVVIRHRSKFYPALYTTWREGR